MAYVKLLFLKFMINTRNYENQVHDFVYGADVKNVCLIRYADRFVSNTE